MGMGFGVRGRAVDNRFWAFQPLKLTVYARLKIPGFDDKELSISKFHSWTEYSVWNRLMGLDAMTTLLTHLVTPHASHYMLRFKSGVELRGGD